MLIIGMLVLGVVALGVIYAFVIRPWHLRWGSTTDEVQRSLPGDDLVPNPKFVWNQAITINASAAEVWPWLVQIGNQRAGWYSWDGLHRLMGIAGCVDDDRRSADRIIPELQNLEVGDVIRMASPDSPIPPPLKVVSIEPTRALLTQVDNENPVSWVWFLDPIDADTTRLITRYRQDWEPGLMGLTIWIGDELGSLVMTPKTLSGIKQRAEALAGQ
jgi:hypothetical protein